MSRSSAPARRIASGFILLALCVSGSAFAQDDEDSAPEPEVASEPEQPREEEAEQPGQTEEQPGPIENKARAAVEVERLSGEAFPEPYTRGLHGGSLWLTMHGLQWPYMPGPAESVSLGFSGSVWVDTSYQSVTSGLPETDPSIKEWRQQSRLVLRATPTFNAGDGWFVQGQGEAVLNGASPSPGQGFLVADDIYVRAGKWNNFDITAGRIQGWEIYHLGMGLDLNTVERRGARTDLNPAVDLYGVTYLWDRPDGPGRLALHYYATDYLRFELLGQIGSSALNSLGVRPVGILDLGVIKVKAGAEYLKETPRQDSADRKDEIESRGVGGTIQVVLDPYFEGGIAFAHALVDTYNVQGILDAGRSTTTTSYGVFANVRPVERLLLGVGANNTNEHNLKVDITGRLNDVRTHLQAFGAAQYAFWDQFYVKGVFAYANSHINPESNPPPITEFRNKMVSFRLRLMYLF
ncbi:MAG: hypothetical protein ABW217_08215 [Polyangiaceae bacterium]